MSLAVADSEPDALACVRAGVPVLPSWTLPRAGLDRLLDLGAGGVLTVVSAPTGAGKTLGVTSWVSGPSAPPRVLWLNLARGGADPDRVWRLLRRGLREAGGRPLPSVPAGPAFDPARAGALVELGGSLRGEEPWTVVLDGYPTGTPGQLGSELEIVLDHADRALRVVLLCQADPALDLHRFSAAGELVQVDAAQLVMGHAEIAELLREASGSADTRVVAAVADRTLGWACGVRRAAVTLAGQADLADAMAETDRAIEDYLAREVLAGMTAPVRRLLVWTSVVEVVTPGVVRAVLGPDTRRAIDRTIALTGLVQRWPDGSLSCHPLLRTAARSQLGLEQPDQARAAHDRVVSWFAEHGEVEAAVELSLAAQDWDRVAAILVAGHAVPRIVAGTAGPVVRRAAGLPQVQAAEPLLQAAVALGREDLVATEVALGRRATRRRDVPAELLASAFLQLQLARLAGRPLGNAGVVPRTRGLLAQSSVSAADGLADLTVSLEALAGAMDLSSGRLGRAAIALTRGADHPVVGPSDVPSTDCAGQLALLEAYRGNLDQATARAQAVIHAATDRRQAGVKHALVALAWVHVDRGELAEARAVLDRADDAWDGTPEPWLALARQLVEARLLIASGRADEAMRRAVVPAHEDDNAEHSEWFTGLVSTLSAEALLAAGEPQQALALVTAGLPASSAERAVLTAVARRDIGDVRGAGAAIASAAYDLPGAPRAIQLQGWLVEARLAHERGDAQRTTLLVERALRAAAAEQLRRPLASDAAWLRWFLDREGASLREHRAFVASLSAQEPSAPRPRPASTPVELVLEPLTERETQVLELLAQMCSTDEIAAELFVSANTVKTHLKGIFRKYSVNRRVDAVRRGRELGVC